MTAFTFRQIKNLYLQGYKVESSIVHGYLDNGNNPNYQDRALSTPALLQGRTLLHYAAANGDIDSIRALVSRGANPNIQDDCGWTALHFAIDFELVVATQDGNLPQSLPVTRILLKCGADDSIPNYKGDLPIDFISGFEEVVSFYQKTKSEVQRYPQFIRNPLNQLLY